MRSASIANHVNTLFKMDLYPSELRLGQASLFFTRQDDCPHDLHIFLKHEIGGRDIVVAIKGLELQNHMS